MYMNVIYEYDLLAVHSPVEEFAQHVMIMKGCHTKKLHPLAKLPLGNYEPHPSYIIYVGQNPYYMWPKRNQMI